MSFPVLDDIAGVSELLKKKEYIQYKLGDVDHAPHNENFLNDLLRKEGNITLHSHQLFLRNLIAPHTPYNRLLIKHMTGTGKTIASLSIAQEFIARYKQLYLMHNPNPYMPETVVTPVCYIIGFSKHVFQKELLRHPEFGFISKTEIEDYKKLKRLAESGTKLDSAALSEFEIKIKKRISNKGLGGFYKFYGYKEFYNRMFIFSDKWNKNVSSDEDPDEQEIIRGIRDGLVSVNYELIEKMANSLVICDEIHNVYNSLEVNNYGLALGVLLDIFDIPDSCGFPLPDAISKIVKASSLRMLYMSATPINNSPTECVDLINLLVHRSKKIKKEDLFSDNRTLLPGALDTIRKLVTGKVSFLQDTDPKYFPRVIDDGESLKGIPYIKFTRCKMSKLHMQTYSSLDSVPPDGQTILDIVFPNPSGGDGLYKTKEIKYAINNAPSAWKDNIGISIIKQSVTGTNKEVDVITGKFLEVDRIGKYSAKYHKLLVDLNHNVSKNLGKVMIVHQYVKMSGVLLIQEMLRMNGYIDEFSNPTENTRCSVCGITAHKHSQRGTSPISHEYTPCRFILAYGDIEKNIMDKSIEKYNGIDNMNGHRYKILIGSKMIKESYDFKDVRHEWVVYPPSNISSLIQIFGRSSRKNSHINLPQEDRYVCRRIYVSSLGGKNLSYEETRYYEKMRDYLVIQQIIGVLNANAIDATINLNTNYPKNLPKIQTLDSVYAPPKLSLGMGLGTRVRDLRTFNVYNREDEISVIITIIKRLFIEQSAILTYDDLWKFVRHPPFDVHVSSDMFSEDNFKIALHKLLYVTNGETVSATGVDESISAIDSIYDSSLVAIKLPGDDVTEYRIVYLNGYFGMVPMTNKPLLSDNLYNPGSDITEIIGNPDVYEDFWLRSHEKIGNLKIDISQYLKTSNVSYENMKYNFYTKYKNISINNMPITSELYGLDFHIRLVEESIRYVFNILTNAAIKFSELHEFYFKMLYYYNRLDMVVFANNLTEIGMNDYSQYITLKPIKGEDGTVINPENKYNAFLMSSILKTTNNEPKFNIDRLNNIIKKSRSSTPAATSELVKRSEISDLGITKELKKTTAKILTKVFANMLPVGHLLTPGTIVVPKLYNPDDDSWYMSPEFNEKSKRPAVENNIVIGYYEKNPVGIDIKFKIRSPLAQQVKHADSRMLERGAACNTRTKEELTALAAKLKLKLADATVSDLCHHIKLELMKREMEARRLVQHKGGKQIKWFYLHFE